ncbi:MAG: hypothetical protein ABIQ72_10100 [Usitatibacter sp.]
MLGGAMLLRGGKDGTPSGPAPGANATDANARQSPEVVLRIAPGAPGPTRAAAPSKISPLMREANGGGSAKPIYDRLIASSSRTPEENYLLAEIIRMCGRRDMSKVVPAPAEPPMSLAEAREKSKANFLASISEKDPTRDKRLKAFTQATQNRCDGMEGVKFNEAELRELIEKGAAGGDPKARARLIEKDIWAPLAGADGNMKMGPEFKMPRITDSQLEGLREAARSGDPSALMIVGRVLSSTMEDLTIRAGPHEQTVDARAFFDAWTLLTCDAGFDCGPNNGQVLFACYAQGNCDAGDLREAQFFYNNSPQQSQRVAEYQSQLARAIQTGDWSYFQFVRARPPTGMTSLFGMP